MALEKKQARPKKKPLRRNKQAPPKKKPPKKQS